MSEVDLAQGGTWGIVAMLAMILIREYRKGTVNSEISNKILNQITKLTTIVDERLPKK